MSDPADLVDLLRDSPKNWGKWGPQDEIGALNYLDAAQVLRGANEIRDGKVFTLQRLINNPLGDPAAPGREPAEVTMVVDESSWDDGTGPQYPGGGHFADDRISAFLQGSTQYDGLGHAWIGGQLYNGFDARTTIGGMRFAGAEPIARRGVVGRAVLIDLAKYLGVDVVPAGRGFSLQDLLSAADEQGTAIEDRDIIVLRTNHLQSFYDDRERFLAEFNEPGLQYSPDLVQWFQDREIPNLVTDTIANELTIDDVSGAACVLHSALMRNLGVLFTELTDLEALAADCARDGRYTFFYVGAPLRIHESTGAPVNPVAIK